MNFWQRMPLTRHLIYKLEHVAAYRVLLYVGLYERKAVNQGGVVYAHKVALAVMEEEEL